MDRIKLQEAVTHILAAYLSSHKIGADQVAGLVGSVGQVLTAQAWAARRDPEAEPLVPPALRSRRPRARGKDVFEVDTTRIEHPDQLDIFGEAEADLAEALIGESAGDRGVADGDAPVSEVEAVDGHRARGPRSRRDIAEAEAETVIEDGVPITRIPEVRRRR